MTNLVENEKKVEPIGDTKVTPIGNASAQVEKQWKHFGIPVTLGSRKVEVLQVPKFSLLPKGADAAIIRAEQVKKIGSQWKAGTRDVIRGLTTEEELYYLPQILGINPTSDEWNNKVQIMWADFAIEIPYGTKGVELEVGFKEVAGKVMPISIDDYMKFGFCKANSDVAVGREADDTFHYSFYVVDKAKKLIDEESRFASKKKIDILFLKLVSSDSQSDLNKIDWILEVEGGDSGQGISTINLSRVQKEMELEKIKDRDLERFANIIKDVHLETKALIRSSVERGNIIQEGNSYFLDSKVIGSNLMEAVAYLENPANQKEKLIVVERNKSSLK